VGKSSQADFGSLQVGKQGYSFAVFVSGRTDSMKVGCVIGVRPVAEIHAGDIKPGCDESIKNPIVSRGWPESADNFGAAHE
jgi:hypothetical protein